MRSARSVVLLGLDSKIATAYHATTLTKLFSYRTSSKAELVWLNEVGLRRFIFQYLKCLFSSSILSIVSDWRLSSFFYLAGRKFVFWEVENPYHLDRSWRSDFLIFLMKRVAPLNKRAVLLSTDRYREKLNRRYFRYALSGYQVIARAELESIEAGHGLQKQSGQPPVLGYFGRFSDLTGAKELLTLARENTVAPNYIGPFFKSHMSEGSALLIKDLDIRERLFSSVEEAFREVIKSDVLIGVTKRDPIDPGTKYQTPGKILDYLWSDRPIIATYSLGLDELFDHDAKQFGVFFVSQSFDVTELENAILSAKCAKVVVTRRLDLLRRIFAQNTRRVDEVVRYLEF